jgi:hypothetical protein
MAFLKITSNAVEDFDGVPSVSADDQAFHTLTITKMVDSATPVGAGGESLRVLVAGLGVQLSADALTLVDGTVTLTVGPASVAGDAVVKFVSTDGTLRGQIPLRFRRATKDRRFDTLLLRDQATGETYKVSVSSGVLAAVKV